MNFRRAGRDNTLLLSVTKYLLPLELRLPGVRTIKAPTKQASIVQLASQQPDVVSLHHIENPPTIPRFECPQIFEGRWSTHELPRVDHPYSFVASIRDGLSYGRHCTAIAAREWVVDESGFYDDRLPVSSGIGWRHIPFSLGRLRRRWQADLTSRFRLPRVRRIDARVATLNTRFCHNYFHWLLDVLPRFAILGRAGIEANFFLVDCHTDSQRRALAALGISEDRLIQPHCGLSLEAEELLVPSFPTPSCLRAFRDLLHQAFVPATAGSVDRPTGRRLYISRRNAATRRLKNEAEVSALLECRGFETHCMEEYDIAGQARLIHDADVIVATHGAGLANLAFARPGAAVVEVVQADRYNADCYPDKSRTFGLRHWQVLAPRSRHKQILEPSLGDLALAVDAAESCLAQNAAA